MRILLNRWRNLRQPAWWALAALLLAQAACASPFGQTVVVVTATPLPTEPPQPTPIVLIVTATPAAPSATPAEPALPTPTIEPASLIATATQPPVPAAPTLAPQPTKPPKPSPTPLVLRTARIEGDQGKIRAQFIYSDLDSGTDILFFQVEARNPSVGKADGAGIIDIEFSIVDDNGNEVFHNVESNPHYCAFGGGEPTCNVVRLNRDQTWPNTGNYIQSGHYTITATIHAADGNEWSGSVDFDLYLP